MDRNRLTYRKTTFDIPSNRNLWLTLGQYDALVEYQEVASRYYLGTFDAKKESFDSFLSRTSIATGVRLNNISLANFREKQYQGYLVFPNASFDDFITNFVDDVKFLIDPAFSLSKINGSKFDKLVDALLQIGISPSIGKFKKDLYDYYRLLRNDVAHSLNQNYEKEYKTLDKKAIAAFYTTLSEPKEKSKLSFDDFILCTANIKNIADLLTISLLPNINWEQLVLNNREQLIPKYERFVHGGRTKRLQTYVLNCIRTLYGYTLDELTINNIIGSLE